MEQSKHLINAFMDFDHIKTDQIYEINNTRIVEKNFIISEIKIGRITEENIKEKLLDRYDYHELLFESLMNDYIKARLNNQTEFAQRLLINAQNVKVRSDYNMEQLNNCLKKESEIEMKNNNEKSMMEQNIPLGRYRHYKGKEYDVIGIGKHTETLETMVIYRALYDDCALWVRPASMWNEIIEKDGISAKRFEYIGD